MSVAKIRAVVDDAITAANTRLVMWSDDGKMVFWGPSTGGHLEDYDSGNDSDYNKVGTASDILIPDANVNVIEWTVPVFATPDVPNIFWYIVYETGGPTLLVSPTSIVLDGNSARVSKGTSISFRE